MTDDKEQKREFKLKGKYLNAKQEEIKQQDINEMIQYQSSRSQIETFDFTSHIKKNLIKFILLSGTSVYLRQQILQNFIIQKINIQKVYRQTNEKWAYYIYQYEKGQLGRKLIQPKTYYNHYILPFSCYYILDFGVAAIQHTLLKDENKFKFETISSILKSLNVTFCSAIFISRNPKVLGVSFTLGNILFMTKSIVNSHVSPYF